LKITCLVVEDEPLARNLIVDYVKKVPFLELSDAVSSPLRALELLKTNPVQLLFLDIQMPEITGITLLKTLQQKPLVILTTAYSEYALEGYELDVVDYLLKPITFDRFLKAVDKAAQRLNPASVTAPVASPQTPNPFVFVKDGTRIVKIRWDDILFVEGLKDYVTIHTKTQKIVTLQRLKTLEDQLPAEKFVRVHHSYIIAVDAIETVNKGEIKVGNTMIPISETYKKSFKDFIERNQMGS